MVNGDPELLRIFPGGAQSPVHPCTFLTVHPELVDGESSKYSAIVTVYLKDGKRYQKRVDKAEGTPDVPITWEELLAKYRGCAQLVLSEDKIKRSIELLEHFEALKDINELTSIIM